ncbi:hypothetical protein [Fulvivirga sp.]|uniref:hypothetical protein n=1 Tax=Fulvivirga sp. TaxID=1931237 RepID=UPI0032EC7B36
MRYPILIFLGLVFSFNVYSQISVANFEIKGCPFGDEIIEAPIDATISIAQFGLNRYPIKYKGDTLKIPIGLNTNCQMGETYGVEVNADTIILKVGTELWYVKDENGEVDSTEYEISAALCNCYLQFTFSLTGDFNRNDYYLNFGYLYPNSKSILFDTTNKKKKSIYYNNSLDLLTQIQEYISSGQNSYVELATFTEDIKTKNTLSEAELKIYKTIIRSIIRVSKALTDEFLVDKIDEQKLKKLQLEYIGSTKNLKKQIADNYKILQQNEINLKYWIN